MTTELVIDASLMGSMARFINHSCDPNCVTEKWNVGSKIRMGIFAAKKIPKEEEVASTNYHFQSFGEIKERCVWLPELHGKFRRCTSRGAAWL